MFIIYSYPVVPHPYNCFLTWITKGDIYRMSKLVFSIQSSNILSEYYISACSSLKSIIRLKYSDSFFFAAYRLKFPSTFISWKSTFFRTPRALCWKVKMFGMTWGWVNKTHICVWINYPCFKFKRCIASKHGCGRVMQGSVLCNTACS